VDDVELRPLNARSLVLSVLLGLPTPRLDKSSPGRLAELFAIAPGTMRTAISRMLAAGELAVVGDGYELRAERLLARKHAQDIGRRPVADAWDGSWWVVTVAAPSRGLGARREFRTAMANARMGELRPETWLRPANLAAPAGIDGTVVIGGRLSGTEPADLVTRLWDLRSMGAQCTALLNELGTCLTMLERRGARALARTTMTSAAVVRFLRVEPMLPRRLVPPDWPVDALRDLYADFDRVYGRVLGEALGDQPLP